MRKTTFCICKNKGADQLCCNHEVISAFVFPTQIVQFLFFLNLKFPASIHLCSCTAQFVLGLIRNHISHDPAYFVLTLGNLYYKMVAVIFQLETLNK